MKTELSKALPYWGMGEYLEMVFMKHVQESIIKKGVPS
jgi:hypothetical protein